MKQCHQKRECPCWWDLLKEKPTRHQQLGHLPFATCHYHHSHCLCPWFLCSMRHRCCWAGQWSSLAHNNRNYLLPRRKALSLHWTQQQQWCTALNGSTELNDSRFPILDKQLGEPSLWADKHTYTGRTSLRYRRSIAKWPILISMPPNHYWLHSSSTSSSACLFLTLRCLLTNLKTKLPSFTWHSMTFLLIAKMFTRSRGYHCHGKGHQAGLAWQR